MKQNLVRLRFGEANDSRTPRIAQVSRPFAPFPLRHLRRHQCLEARVLTQQRSAISTKPGEIGAKRPIPVSTIKKPMERLPQHRIFGAGRSRPVDQTVARHPPVTARAAENQLRRGMQRIQEQPA